MVHYPGMKIGDKIGEVDAVIVDAAVNEDEEGEDDEIRAFCNRNNEEDKVKSNDEEFVAIVVPARSISVPRGIKKSSRTPHLKQEFLLVVLGP